MEDIGVSGENHQPGASHIRFNHHAIMTTTGIFCKKNKTIKHLILTVHNLLSL